jgi:hypothetical protein
MILQHPIHYDDFDDEALSNITGHRLPRGNWTQAWGVAAQGLLRGSELYLAPAALLSFYLSTDILESDDQRIEAKGIIRGDYPNLDILLRWDGQVAGSLGYLLSRFIPATGAIVCMYAHGGGVTATFTDAGFGWNVGDEIFMEIIAIQRDVTFRTTNLTNHYTAHFDYRIPEADAGFGHYGGLGLVPTAQQTNYDNAFDYFKVFPAGEPTP